MGYIRNVSPDDFVEFNKMVLKHDGGDTPV